MDFEKCGKKICVHVWIDKLFNNVKSIAGHKASYSLTHPVM